MTSTGVCFTMVYFKEKKLKNQTRTWYCSAGIFESECEQKYALHNVCDIVPLGYPDHCPNGHNPEWTPSRMDTIPNGCNPEYIHSRMNTIPNRYNPELTPSRMDTIPNGRHSAFRMDTVPNGHKSEWTQSRMDTIPNEHLPSYFGVLNASLRRNFW